MHITCENTGRRFNKEWIFRSLNCTLEVGSKFAVLGRNGSGKSTFLQVLAGMQTPSEGKVVWKSSAGEGLNANQAAKSLSFCSPQQLLIEEFTLVEMLKFWDDLKPFVLPQDEVIQLLGLEKASKRPIQTYSSGMKQRVKLGLALLGDAPVVLLDEPCTNLDQEAKQWYLDLVERFTAEKTVVVCTNDPQTESPFCENALEIERYKPDSTYFVKN